MFACPPDVPSPPGFGTATGSESAFLQGLGAFQPDRIRALTLLQVIQCEAHLKRRTKKGFRDKNLSHPITDFLRLFWGLTEHT